MNRWLSYVFPVVAFPVVALAAFNAAPAAAQGLTTNMGQTMTPFSTNQPSVFAPGQGGGASGGFGPGHHGGFHPHPFPIFIYPFASELDTPSVQSNPVNTAPFAPPAPPAAGDRPPPGPYKPPTVEIAPSGVEIVRGPG